MFEPLDKYAMCISSPFRGGFSTDFPHPSIGDTVQRKRLTAILVRSTRSPSRILSLSPGPLYFFAGMLVFLWVLLAVGGYLGKRLHSDYHELKEKNYYLLQKEQELQELRQVMVRIQTEEDTLRDYVGLRTRQEKKTTRTDVLKGVTQKSDQGIERR